jgi:Tfp pilus assembly protein PilX
LPLSYQWLQEANGVFVPLSDAGQFSGSASNVLTIENLTLADATNYEVVVSNNWGAVTSSFAKLTIVSQTGILIAASAAPPAIVDLTATGTLDWAHWGLNDITSFDQKAAVVNQIGTFSTYGDPGSGPTQNSGAPQAASWSDGTPDPTETDSYTGVYWGGVNNGFQFSVGASAVKQILTVYVDAYSSHLHFEAALSDGSAPAFVDESVTTLAYDDALLAYTIEFAAASPGQTLNITAYSILDNGGGGNTELMSAVLYGPEPNILTQPVSLTNNVTTTALITAVAEGWAPLSYQWWGESNGVYVPLTDGGQISGSGTPSLSINSLVLANATNYYVVITNSYGSATSSVANLTVLPITGAMIGSVVTGPATVDLTIAGTLDWADWGVLSGLPPNYLEQKAGGTNQISDITTIGAGSGPNLFNNALVACSWSDGTPDATVIDTTTGIYFNGINNGYQFTVPADKTKKILTVYAGGYQCQVQVQATLSDFSAPPFIDNSLITTSGDGSANAYTIAFAAGTNNQTLTVTVTCLTDGGNCTLIAATLAGPPPVILDQPVSITNNAGTAAQFSATLEGWPPLSYQWWVEANGTYVPLADGGQISGSATATLSVSELAFANATNYYVVITNSYGAVTSSVANLTVLPVTGSLIGSAVTTPAFVNLTAEGTLDWADWGEASGLPPNYLEQKIGGTNQISDATAIGVGSGPNYFNGTVVATSWTDGTPDPAETNTSGIYYVGLDDGYQITVPADTTMKVLTVYAGGYGTIVNFRAALSDLSAPPYVDETLVDPGGNSNGSADAYKLAFAAGSANQTLTVTVTCAADYGGGNVTLMAATLQAAPLTLSIGYSGTNLKLTWASGTLLQATNLLGPWTTNSAPSPYTVTPSAPQMFYKVLAQ